FRTSRTRRSVCSCPAEGAEPGAFGPLSVRIRTLPQQAGGQEPMSGAVGARILHLHASEEAWMAIAVETRAPVTVEPEAAPSVADAIVEATGVDKIYD